MKEIVDEFTELEVKRQRKHQLRHPEKLKEIQARYRQSDKGKEAQHRYYLKRKNKD